MLAPTMPPSEPPSEDGDQYRYFEDNLVWMMMWLCTMVVFIAFPFCTSRRRRELCIQGIRERRWISDDEYDYENGSGRQGRRQHQREEAQRHFQTTRTQEDEIRHQFLSMLMESYTMSLTTSDICDENSLTPMDVSKSIDEDREEIEKDVENQCDTTLISSEVGSQDTIDTNDDQVTNIGTLSPIREKRCDSEDSEQLLSFDFDKDQKICVPVSGQAVMRNEQTTEIVTRSGTTSRRLVSNGCAICLCLFEADEEITWSANPQCCHVFHSDCIINWYLAVGRKAQRRHKRNNPNMTDEEALDLICKFPILCPCCRQPFCADASSSCEKPQEISNNTGGGDNVDTSSNN